MVLALLRANNRSTRTERVLIWMSSDARVGLMRCLRPGRPGSCSSHSHPVSQVRMRGSGVGLALLHRGDDFFTDIGLTDHQLVKL